jgi:GxxExxY protein
MNITKSQLTDLTYDVIGAAITVHKEIGPGLLESVYHECLKSELEERCINYRSELIVPVFYKGKNLDAKLRCDLLVEDALVIELKSVEQVQSVHSAQLLTYLKLLKKPKGILINFNCSNIMKEGQQTFVNDIFRALPD